MKILVLTQKVDSNDSVLGFFHRWLHEFSKSFEQVTAVCLQKGSFDLPNNVKVLSLGKEKGVSRLKYVLNFYRYIWRERKNYDVVFVHMNQEYVFLGWKLWKLLGKKVFLWRNHKKGNIFTRIAVLLSDAVFCTSPGSFTAQFKKTKIMPVGVDSDFFRRMPEISRIPQSILLLGRISPVKHVDVFVEALTILHSEGQPFVAHIYGNPTPSDKEYFKKIKEVSAELVRAGKLIFNPEVPNTKTPEIYNAHEISVNLTDAGSFDKTIVEAMLSETLVLVSNPSLTDLLTEEYMFKDVDAASLAKSLTSMLTMDRSEKEMRGKKLRTAAEKHSLQNLVRELVVSMSSK